MKKTLLMAVAVVMAIFSPQAFAADDGLSDDKACVYVKVGAGFAAKMRVLPPGVDENVGGDEVAWTKSVAIGKTACQSVNLPFGAKYRVQVSPSGGKKKVCGTSTASRYGHGAFYIAWGTTLSPKCELQN